MFYITFADGFVFVGLFASVAGSISNSRKWRTDVSTVNKSFINSVLVWFGGSLIASPGIIISSLFILNPWYKIIIIILIILGICWLAYKNNLLKFPTIVDVMLFLCSSFVFLVIAYVALEQLIK
jgi:hypothetical protein|tara:strand:- start:506 stop:877 length:372 start_codon:yes stop_codon:yes gene_type:complete